jgi:predicted Rossmann-fold nucleotide-binding protein
MFPVVLMGVAYWSRLLDFIRGTLVRNKTIDAADTRLLTVTDSPDEAAAAVQRALRQYDKNWKAPRRNPVLGEKALPND